MPQRYATEYIDRLLQRGSYSDLVELSGMICSSGRFQAQQPDYGLPRFAFVFVETLLWFAQAIRSGVWTYYEATREPRQRAMVGALRDAGPADFATWYERGMRDWSVQARIAEVDVWMKTNDERATIWLHELIAKNSEEFLELTTD